MKFIIKKSKLKTFLSIAVVASMLFVFTGCSNSSKSNSSDSASLSKFTAETLNGEKFSQDNLKNHKMTVVNVWSTTCGYCVDELPALQKLSTMLPYDVQLITICIDGSEQRDTAKRIISEQGFTGTVLIDGKDLNKVLIPSIQGTPTTLFFDKDGKQVGRPKVGTYSSKDMDEVANEYLKEVNKHLKKIS